MAKYLDKDIASFEAGIFLSIGFAMLVLVISIVLISNGWPFTGMFIGGIFAAALFSSWQNIQGWMQERYYVAAFKSQTRDLFVFSNGISESEEDDNTVIQRLEFALAMLRRVENPHGITVWVCLFRDATVFGYKTGKGGKVVSVIRLSREGLIRNNAEHRAFGEGLMVRESRAQYLDFCSRFRAEKEQEQLAERRENNRSDYWVNAHWFGQEKL